MDMLDRMLDTMTSAFSAMGRGSARWVTSDGVGALVSPDVSERSIVNCVIYKRGADVESVYGWLEEQFAAADAWTVWVPEADTDTAAFLESRGHKLDAEPAMIVLELASYQP